MKDFTVGNQLTLSATKGSHCAGIPGGFVPLGCAGVRSFRSGASTIHELRVDPRFRHFDGVHLSFIDDLEVAAWSGQALMILSAVFFPGDIRGWNPAIGIEIQLRN